MENIVNESLTTQATNTSVYGADEARYFGIFVGALVILFGTVGNGLTVWAYLRNKNLQTSFNVLIANLCLIDLLFTVIVIPFLLPGYIVGMNIYHEALCDLISYMYYVTLAASLYNLVAIAVNRYIGIVWSSRYQKLFSGRRLAICIASIWLVPAILYLPLVIGGAYAWNEDVIRCGLTNNMPRAIRWYNLALNIIFQAVPLLILIVAYSAIFRKVKRVKSKMKGHQKSRLRSTSSASSALRNKSGNTSDDTGDDMKPSSLIEGPISFYPARNVSEQKDSGSGSHETSLKGAEATEEETKSMDKQTSVSITDETIKMKAVSTRKRNNSIWTILLQNNNRKFKSINGHATLPKTFNTTPYENHASDDDMSNSTSSHDQQIEAHSLDVIGLKSIHRKKSLSTPTLPTFDLDNFNLSRIDSKTKQHSTYLRKYQEDVVKVSDTKTNEERVEKQPRSRTTSDTTQTMTMKSTYSVKTQKTRKEKLSTSSMMQVPSDNDSFHKSWSRRSTMKKSKEDKKTQSRNRTLRKKRERERQLAYSSFMICIAFAVCILPTSLLYLTRILTGIVVPSSTILIISCIAWVHAVVNPWIYGYLNMQYKKEYLKIFKQLKQKLSLTRQPSTNTGR